MGRRRIPDSRARPVICSLTRHVLCAVRAANFTIEYTIELDAISAYGGPTILVDALVRTHTLYALYAHVERKDARSESRACSVCLRGPVLGHQRRAPAKRTLELRLRGRDDDAS